MVFATLVLYLAESSSGKEVSGTNVLWTTVFTIVGAADFADNPSSHTGKFIIFILSICGIGIVGWIIAEVAGNFVLKKIKGGLGMGESIFKNHCIICGWNSHAMIVIDEFIKCKKPLVLIADIENPFPSYDGEYCFIQGDCRDKETLARARISTADVAIILADKLGIENKNINDIDANTILTALMINKEVGEHIKTIIELLNPKNKHFAEDAGVDDIILYNDFAAKIFATCALNPGMSKIFSGLLSFGEGYEFFTDEIHSKFTGKPFSEIIAHYRHQEMLPIAVLNGNKPMINPPDSLIITKGNRVVYIAKEKLSINSFKVK